MICGISCVFILFKRHFPRLPLPDINIVENIADIIFIFHESSVYQYAAVESTPYNGLIFNEIPQMSKSQESAVESTAFNGLISKEIPQISMF